MNPPTSRVSLPAVTAAGVVGIIFGVFGALGSALAGFSVLVLPKLPQNPAAPPMPPAVTAMSVATMFFMFALAVAGIFVGVGVIRRRNWARISMLIWGGLLTFFCLTAMAFSFVIFSIMPKLDLPNANTAQVSNVLLFIRIFLLIFYGIPAAVGIWWLVLFTRPRVSAAFRNPVQAVPLVDASGFPPPALPAAPPQPKRPACPVPLAILAGLFIFSGFFSVLFLLLPFPVNFPLYLFGRVYFGFAPKLFLGFTSLLMGIAGIGMLKLKPWALYTILALQSIFFVNGLFAIISPTFQTDMHEAMEKMSRQYSAFPGARPFPVDMFIKPGMIFGLVFGAVIIVLLASYRARFLEQAEAAASV